MHRPDLSESDEYFWLVSELQESLVGLGCWRVECYFAEGSCERCGFEGFSPSPQDLLCSPFGVECDGFC